MHNYVSDSAPKMDMDYWIYCLRRERVAAHTGGIGSDRSDDDQQQQPRDMAKPLFPLSMNEYLLMVGFGRFSDFHFFFFACKTRLVRFLFRLTNLKTSILRTYSFGSRRLSTTPVSGWSLFVSLFFFSRRFHNDEPDGFSLSIV